jgi:hypothetical protein
MASGKKVMAAAAAVVLLMATLESASAMSSSNSSSSSSGAHGEDYSPSGLLRTRKLGLFPEDCTSEEDCSPLQNCAFGGCFPCVPSGGLCRPGHTAGCCSTPEIPQCTEWIICQPGQ